jgi:uncharacterized peroxidase-related enzyme
MAWIQTTDPDDDLLEARSHLSIATENAGSQLDAQRRALISYLVSSLNRSVIDQWRSRQRVIALGVTPTVLDALTRRRYQDLDPGDAAIARYVHRLTVDPGGLAEEDIEDLREVGLGDREILDLNNRVAYLNYTNRVANGLGLLDDVDAESGAAVTAPRT